MVLDFQSSLSTKAGVSFIKSSKFPSAGVQVVRIGSGMLKRKTIDAIEENFEECQTPVLVKESDQSNNKKTCLNVSP